MKCLRVRDWDRLYEVNDKGGSWLPGQRKRQGPLEFIRWRVNGGSWSAGFREFLGAAGEKGAAVCFGVFGKILEVAGDQEADRRGWLVDRRGRALDAGGLARMVGFDVRDVARALEVLAGEAVGWLEWGEFGAVVVAAAVSTGEGAVEGAVVSGDSGNSGEGRGLPGNSGEGRGGPGDSAPINTIQINSNQISLGAAVAPAGAVPPPAVLLGDASLSGEPGGKGVKGRKRGDEVLLVFPCSGRPGEWGLTRGKLAEWHGLYGKQIDVFFEAKKARQWVVDNLSKRKTAGGMPRFLSRWFASAVDSGRGARGDAGGRGPVVQKDAAARERERNMAHRAALDRENEEARLRAGPVLVELKGLVQRVAGDC